MTLKDADATYYLLRFNGEGYGAMSGVQEYVVITQDTPEVHQENHGCPGFTLEEAIKIVHRELYKFPVDTSLIRTY